MNAFHVCGGLLAIWALVVSFLGITREDFPGGKAEAAVAVISTILTVLAIGSAIYTSANEENPDEEGGEEAALTVPA